MLIQRCNNSWIKFRVLFHQKMPEKEGLNLAKQAFLCVVSWYNSFNSPKEEMLCEITSACSDVMNIINDREIFEQIKQSLRTGVAISPTELHWVRKYIKDVSIHIRIETIIYASLCRSSDYDQIRHEFKGWSLTKKKKQKILKKLLYDKKLSLKRKKEIDHELSGSRGVIIGQYIKELLVSGNFNEAERSVGEVVDQPDVIVDAICECIDQEMFNQARIIAHRYLPDLAEEVIRIRNAT